MQKICQGFKNKNFSHKTLNNFSYPSIVEKLTPIFPRGRDNMVHKFDTKFPGVSLMASICLFQGFSNYPNFFIYLLFQLVRKISQIHERSKKT